MMLRQKVWAKILGVSWCSLCAVPEGQSMNSIANNWLGSSEESSRLAEDGQDLQCLAGTREDMEIF